MPEGGDPNKRTQRFALSVPVQVTWRELDGREIIEPASASEVSITGGVLDIAKFPSSVTEITVTEVVSNRTARARIVRVENKADGASYRLIIEFRRADERFWGVNFQLKKSTADLVELERVLISGNMDARVLREFRDAVDYVRKAAWVVQEWQERRTKQQDISTVLPLLTFERIRRATQLCNTIVADLEDQRTSAKSSGIPELQEAVEALRERLAGLEEQQHEPPR
jgi:hypothetical protein